MNLSYSCKHFNSIKRKATHIAVAFLVCASPIPSAIAEIPGEWTLHHSFYRQMEKIIDGESATYFLLHQQPYSQKNEGNTENAATLFIFDKHDPDRGIYSVAEQFPGFPSIIRNAVYSPERRRLIAIDEGSTVWVLPDGGNPYAIYGTEGILIPGKPSLKSLVENPIDGKIWIGASYGYSIVDPEKRRTERTVLTDFPVDCIVSVGENIIIYSGGRAYCAPQATYPGKLEECHELTFTPDETTTAILEEGHLKNPYSIMPLTGNSFAFISGRTDGKSGQFIGVATRLKGEWKLIAPVSDGIRLLGDGVNTGGRSNNNAYPNKGGYLCQSQTYAYAIARGTDPDFTSADPAADFKKKAIRSQARHSDAWRETASWDMTDFWFYTELKGFYRRTFSSGAWSAPTSSLLPEGPAPFISTNMKWHPDYGMLVGGHGQTGLFTNNAVATPWLLSSLRGEKWEQLSPVFFPPEEIMADETLKTAFNNYANYYPLLSPKGLAIDPKNPKYAYAGSMLTGWARINLSDPSDIPLHAGSEKTQGSTLPGFVKAFPFTNSWTALCNVSEPEFDNEGRLWMAYQDYDENKADNYSISLNYYTRGDLDAMEDANRNPASFRNLRRIKLHVSHNPSSSQMLLPLRGATNSNILAVYTGDYAAPIYLLDHNGTPDDTSDDRLVILKKLYDKLTGDLVLNNRLVAMWEDPASGILWCGGENGVFSINPREAFSTSGAVETLRVRSTPGREKDLKILQSEQVNAFATDAGNRLWIGTGNRGIVCLSASRDEVVAEFDSRNSSLPSDKIFGLCYNPGNNSMMVSTAGGLAEFHIAGAGGSKSAHVTVSPANIAHDYYGWITFSGLPDGVSVAVADSNNNIIKELGTPTQGKVQWDGHTSAGTRSAAGRLRLLDKGTGETLATFHML